MTLCNLVFPFRMTTTTNSKQGKGRSCNKYRPELSVTVYNHHHDEVSESLNRLQSVASDQKGDRDMNEAGPSGMQQIATTPRPLSPSQMDTDSDNASTGGHRTRDVSPRSYRSRSPVPSYVSMKQQPGTRPQYDIPLPKLRNRNPFDIDPNDPDLVGQSEFYFRKPADGCPYCGENHRLIRCPWFKNLDLQGRWYHALNMGACLNCLRWGHSSFRCIKEGACKRCGVRHNSLLCPRFRTDQGSRE